MGNVLTDIYSAFTNNFRSKKSKPDNAIKVGRGERFSGEVAQELPLFRYYEYYFGWPEVKDGINSIHSRWMGIRQELRSEDETFTLMARMWITITGFWPKLSQFSLDALIGGSGIMELQYDGDLLANCSHIPTKSIWKIFRDRHGNVREYIQMIDGEAIALSPKYIMQYNINNPDEEALGHSEIFSIATPQKISGKRDELGNTINPDRYIPSVLDVNARLKFAHMETLEKQARSQIFVTVEGESDKEAQEKIEKELNDPASGKWMHVTNKDVKVEEATVNPTAPFKEYSDEMERSTDRAVGFPGKVMTESGSMSFASSQTPIQEMANRIANKQNDLNRLTCDTIFRILAEQWGFDYEKVRPEIVFVPYKDPLTFDQIMQLEKSNRISDKEFRDMLRHHVQDLNDKEFEKWKKEQQKQLEEAVNVDPRKSKDVRPDNERPDIEKNAERPPKTNSLEHLLKNPKKMERYIIGLIKSHEKQERIMSVRNESDAIYESDPPEITDPKVLERLEELTKQLATSKENLENSGYAGFKNLQDCINANQQESDPKGYCLIEYGRATEKKEAAQAELSDFMNSFKKANDLNNEMFGGDPHHQKKDEDNAVVNKTKSNENDDDPKKHKFLAEGPKGSSDANECQICGFPKSDHTNAKSYEGVFTQTSGTDPIK